MDLQPALGRLTRLRLAFKAPSCGALRLTPRQPDDDRPQQDADEHADVDPERPRPEIDEVLYPPAQEWSQCQEEAQDSFENLHSKHRSRGVPQPPASPTPTPTRRPSSRSRKRASASAGTVPDAELPPDQGQKDDGENGEDEDDDAGVGPELASWWRGRAA